MAIPLVDLKAQYQTIKADINAAVGRVLANASFILGEEVESFERAFAAYHGTRHAVGVDSGTAALHLALLAYGIGPGDEVITTTMTFIATAAAVSHVGARPVLVDIDPRTYNIDPACIEAAITPRTKAIMPVHLYGQPCEMDSILGIADKHGLRVIEDACQAIGASYKGRKAGSLGDVGCFSFYPAKNLGAAGDGGMLITNDDALADCVRKLRDHGRISKYSHGMIGYTYRLDGLQAAILGVKLPHIDAWNEARRQHAAHYSALLGEIPGLVVPYEGQGCRAIYHVYALRAPRRDALLDHLRNKGIGASIHYPLPVHQQPAYASMNLPAGSFPVAEAFSQEEISLPIYPEMTASQVEEVISAVRAFGA